MPVRNLNINKTTNWVRTAIGKADPAGAFTVAGLVKVGPAPRQPLWFRIKSFLEFEELNWSEPELEYEAAGIRFLPGGQSNFEIPRDGHWRLVVFVRPASGEKCKYYIYDFTTKAWTIKEDAAISNITHVGVPTGCMFLGGNGASFEQELRAAVAVFNTAFTQAEAEALKALASLEDWVTKAPLALWLFNQKEASEPLIDLTGNGADEVERHGTAVVAEEPPIPYTTVSVKPFNISAPVLSGTPTVGAELAVTNGKWANLPSLFTYTWQEAQKAAGPWITIAGATEQTFTVEPEQRDRYIRCIVTASNAAGGTEKESNTLGPVAPSEEEEEGLEHGFPDWQDSPEYEPEPEYVNPELAFNGIVNLGPFFVGQVPALDLYLKQKSGNRALQVKVIFHDRRAEEPVVVERTFFLHPEKGLLRIQVPCEARYVTIVLTPVGAVSELKYEVRVQRTLGVASQRRLADPILLNITGKEVKAAETVTTDMTQTAPGPATLITQANAAGATCALELQQLDATGAWVRFLALTVPAGASLADYALTLPASPIRFKQINNGAATVVWDVTLGLA